MNSVTNAIGNAAGIILYLCICGCSVTHTYLVSSANIETSKVSATKVGKIEIGSTVIIIRPDNSIWTGLKEVIIIPLSAEKNDPKDYRFSPFYYKNSLLNTRDPFVVEVLLSPGDHEVIFSPMGLMLQDEKGKKSYPVNFYSLLPRYPTILGLSPVESLCRRPGIESMHIDFSSLLRYESKSHDPMHIAKDKVYCFVIKFDIPPIDPRSVFTIAINDFSVDGQKVSIPVISYRPDTYMEKSH